MGQAEQLSDPQNSAPSKQLSFRRIAERLSRLVGRLQLSEGMVLMGTAVIVGLATGLGAVLFRFMIRAVDWAGYTWLPTVTSGWGKTYVVLMPTVGGLLTGVLVYLFAREAKGHGVPEVMEAVALKGGRIRPVVAVVKSLASSLCIGSGGSVGREGPIVQIGAALGSATGQLLRLSDERFRNLVACGAAGGIAATFNAPIAGVIFALEVILGEFSVEYFSNVVISAVAASAVGQHILGNVSTFHVPMEYSLKSTWEFCLYPILGILAAFAGVAFVRMLYWFEDLFARFDRIPEVVQPALGGALLGGLALVYPLVTAAEWEVRPQVFNVGYEVIGQALSNDLLLGVAASLVVLKLMATCLTLGSGGSGGIFAPSLFMGAMLGTAFGLFVERLFPGIAAPAGAYALVGMAAVFAGAAHAPITAVIILFELTGDYRIILPLMLTVVVATIVSQRALRGESIYTLKLTRRGVRLQHAPGLDVLEGVAVSEVMQRQVAIVDTEATLDDVSQTFRRTQRRGLPVLEQEGKLWGIVTLSDLEEAAAHGAPPTAVVTEAGTPWGQLVLSYPDESLGTVLVRLGTRGLGHMPVVSRDDPRNFLGLVRRQDIIRAYHLALSGRFKTRSAGRGQDGVLQQSLCRGEPQHHPEGLAVRNLDGTEFVELTLTEIDAAVDKTVAAIAPGLPANCLLVWIRRDSRIIIPCGSTVLRAGDRITVFGSREATRNLQSAFREEPEESG